MSLITRSPFVTNQINKADNREVTLIRNIVESMAAHGTPVTKIYDGGEYVKVEDTDDVLTEAYNLDELRLYTTKGSYVVLIMGQYPDTIADWTIDLDESVEDIAMNAED